MSLCEVLDPVFAAYTLPNVSLKQLATGFDWAEGPVWFGDAGCLLFSDVPNDRVMRFTPGVGLSTYRQPSNYANGHTRDREGRLISCEHGMRRVTRTEWDGSITVIADRYQGKPLNSPNDVIVASDGAIWFSDPHYGIASDYEGYRAEQELPCHVYRVDPDGRIAAMVTDFQCPNGLAFSPDEKRLYIAETGRLNTPDPQYIRVFDVGDDWQLSGDETFHVISPGCADGIRVDTDGNLWSSARDGVHCIAPDGHLMGKILLPEVVTNLCFGGRAKHQLYMTTKSSLYMLPLNRRGIQWP